MSVHNGKSIPEVFYGMHFEPGVAEYHESGKDAYRILVLDETIKNMGPSFIGRPVYVGHVDEVNVEKLGQGEEDGWVVECFFNEMDGKHWVKFIAVSDRAKDAIVRGWKLSNAYLPKSFGGGGLWHGVPYQKQVTNAEYEHLAIVPNPRYEGSVILTPDQFKNYNDEKAKELKRLANSKSKGENVGLLTFFKKEKLADNADLESTVVELPKSKEQLTITQLVNEMDEYRLQMKLPHQMANMDHHVKVGEQEMTLNDLMSKHMAMCSELEDMKKPKKEEEKKENEIEIEKTPMPTVEAPKVEDKKDDKFLNDLKNAEAEAAKAAGSNSKVTELSFDKLARGKERYGSK